MNIKQTIMEISLPEISLEELFQAAGVQVSKRPPRPRAEEMLKKALEEARTLVEPKAIWGEVKPVGATEHEVLLGDGTKLTSRLLARIAKSADHLVFLVMTIGDMLDKRVDEYQKLGRMVEAYNLDSVGSACIAKSSIQVIDKIATSYTVDGKSCTFPMGPGHSYWPGLGDVQTIFQILQPAQIGLSLTESNLMLPRKSIAMVMGVGRNLPDFQGKTHCDFCDLQTNCKMSKFGQQC